MQFNAFMEKNHFVTAYRKTQINIFWNLAHSSSYNSAQSVARIWQAWNYVLFSWSRNASFLPPNLFPVLHLNQNVGLIAVVLERVDNYFLTCTSSSRPGKYTFFMLIFLLQPFHNKSA